MLTLEDRGRGGEGVGKGGRGGRVGIFENNLFVRNTNKRGQFNKCKKLAFIRINNSYPKN